MWYLWLIMSGIFLVLEIVTAGFLMFWFGLGSLCAMIVSFFCNNLIVQTAVFLVSSTIFILCTRKFANKLLKNNANYSTNAFSIIGKTGIVTKEINSKEGFGQIKIGTDIWSAKADENEIISANTEVVVLGIDGVKAIVAPKKKN